MTLITVKWTIEDYHRIIEAGVLADRAVELLNGEIVEMPPEGEPHAYYSDEAGDYLGDLLGARAKIREGKPITLPDFSEPEPDLAIVQPLGREYLSHHPYPENVFWVIEFSNSSLSKDLETKRRVYAAVEIPEYWIMNLQAMHLVVFRNPKDGDYQTERIFKTGDLYPITFPGVAVSVGKLLGS